MLNIGSESCLPRNHAPTNVTRTIIRHVILNGHACPANSRWWRPAMTKSATPAAIRSHFSDVCERLGSYQTRSEEHTSELQSLMRISYAVFCLKKKKCSHYSISC